MLNVEKEKNDISVLMKLLEDEEFYDTETRSSETISENGNINP